MGDLPLAALVLVGGYGTRLRPLTFTKSKPLVEFCNKPMCQFMLDALVKVGCKKIVLAVSQIQEDIQQFIKQYQEANPTVEIVQSAEDEPLGTAGPIALAKEHLAGHRFFMLNADVISPYPFEELLEFHIARGGEATIMSWDVEDPSRFGVILSDANGKVSQFVEKPKTFVGAAINAGHYILEPSVIDRIQPKPTSIEREVFPQIAAEGKLYVMPLRGFWMDIGQPGAFIEGIPLLLGGKNGNVLIDETASIGENCQIGPNVVIGPNVTIGANCCIKNSVILANSKVDCSCYIDSSIIGWRNRIGKWVHLANLCVFGDDVAVAAGCSLTGVTVCPHKSIGESIYSAKIVM